MKYDPRSALAHRTSQRLPFLERALKMGPLKGFLQQLSYPFFVAVCLMLIFLMQRNMLELLE